MYVFIATLPGWSWYKINSNGRLEKYKKDQVKCNQTDNMGLFLPSLGKISKGWRQSKKSSKWLEIFFWWLIIPNGTRIWAETIENPTFYFFWIGLVFYPCYAFGCQRKNFRDWLTENFETWPRSLLMILSELNDIFGEPNFLTPNFQPGFAPKIKICGSPKMS